MSWLPINPFDKRMFVLLKLYLFKNSSKSLVFKCFWQCWKVLQFVIFLCFRQFYKLFAFLRIKLELFLWIYFEENSSFLQFRFKEWSCFNSKVLVFISQETNGERNFFISHVDNVSWKWNSFYLILFHLIVCF